MNEHRNYVLVDSLVQDNGYTVVMSVNNYLKS